MTIKNTGMESQQNRTNHSQRPNMAILNATQNLANHLPNKSAFLPTPINAANSNNSSPNTKNDKALDNVLGNIGTVIDKLSSDLNPNTTGKSQPSLEQKEEALLMSLFESLIEMFSGLLGDKKEGATPNSNDSAVKKQANKTPENISNLATSSIEGKPSETNSEATTQEEPLSIKIQLSLLIEFAEMVSNTLEGRSESEFSDIIENIDQEFKQQESIESVMRTLADYAESKKAANENNGVSATPSTSGNPEIPEDTMTTIMELISNILQLLESLGFVKIGKVNT